MPGDDWRVGNSDHMGIVLGKAGRKRWMGRRPHVRGTAMNPIDHPHGGGEGRTKGGRHPVSPWGKLAKGGANPQTSQGLEQSHRPPPSLAPLWTTETTQLGVIAEPPPVVSGNA